MKGKVIKYDMKDINTDLIIPARYLTLSDADYLGKHCMEDLDPTFVHDIKKFGFTILVAGTNFGCGSSREQAPIAIKAAGIQCIIAPSFARIFFRNAINIGLPIIECSNIESINKGDTLEIDFTEGLIKNTTTNVEFEVKKMPAFLQKIISMGGLIKFARNAILTE
ncbi:MAG: 3-isopropylmalate dehydratase small subunit [Candidatus Thorarchaeota archaeon]